jgi:cytochrome c2
MRLAAAFLLLAMPALPALALSPDPGERDFQRCVSCHSVDPAETDLPGPNLKGVLGRRAGTLKGYDYTPEMRASGLVWNRETLDRFLAGPEDLVPGTRMGLPPLRDARLRRSIIDYLARHS